MNADVTQEIPQAYNTRYLSDTAPADLHGLDPNQAIIGRGGEDPAIEQAIIATGRRVYAETSMGSMYMPLRYDPTDHAQQLLIAGDVESAEQVLRFTPDSWATTPERKARVAIGILMCIFNWPTSDDARVGLVRFSHAQLQFYRAIQSDPRALSAYHLMAQIWADLGCHAMAKRTLRIAEELNPHPSTREQLATFPEIKPAESESITTEYAKKNPRILFLTAAHMDHGLDTLFDGLCRVLGEENVDLAPDKPTLRGDATNAWRYPCIFDRKHTSPSAEQAIAAVRDRHYGAILLAMHPGMWEDESMRAIIMAAGDTPVTIIDQLDDPIDYTLPLKHRWNIDTQRFYFKREMLIDATYDERVSPLPLSYSETYAPNTIDAPRNTPLFWAGHRDLAMREIFLQAIETRFEMNLTKEYTPEAYRRALLESRIALCFFGGGFDTVRYYEAPAHGAMLFAERPPIHIPHDFVDGESAVFFETPAEAIEKLAYYLDHPDESAAIAAQGHAHFHSHHTSQARAQQLLSRIFPLA